MPGDEYNAVADQLVGDRYGLSRVTGVVGKRQKNPLPEDAAVGIDIGDRHLGALLDLLTAEDVLSGKRTGGRDQNLGPGAAHTGDHQEGGAKQWGSQKFQHPRLLG